MVVAPDLTSKASRRDWETAFNTSVLTPTMTVHIPFSVFFFLFTFSFSYFFLQAFGEFDSLGVFVSESRRTCSILSGAASWGQSTW